jgi:hypothetical protein
MTFPGCPRNNVGCTWPICGCAPSAIDLHQPSSKALSGAWAAASAHRGEPVLVLDYTEFCQWERVLEAARP